MNGIVLNALLPMSPDRYSELQRETANDPDLQPLRSTVQSGWPEIKEYLPSTLHVYWNFRDEVSCNDGFIFNEK